MKVYIDGQYYDRENAKISVFDHGLLYGDGVFEGIRIYKGHVFKLREHLNRLYRSAKAVFLEIPMNIDAMEEAVKDAVKVNNKNEGYIRLVVTRGNGPLGLNPLQCPKASVIIIVDDIQLYPEELYTEGIKIITSSLRRIPVDCLDPRIKSLNYLNNVMAKLEAVHAGCHEAILLNQEGFVAECTGDNIFIISCGRLFTPISTAGALEGITKNVILDIAGQMGISAYESLINQFDLYNADECFLTGTGAEVIPVVQVDGRKIGTGQPGEITRHLINLFRLEIDDYIAEEK